MATINSIKLYTASEQPYAALVSFTDTNTYKVFVDLIHYTYVGTMKSVSGTTRVANGMVRYLPSEVLSALKLPKDHITTYEAMCGWKAVLMTFEGPEETGMCGWDTEEEAIREAKQWAEEAELPYIARVGVEE